MLAQENDINLATNGADQIWRGVSAGAMAGSWLDTGVMNAGDTRRDLVVGSPGSGAVPGRVHVVFGGPVRSGEVSLGIADVTLTGVPSDRFGTYTATGNIRTTESSGSPRDLVVGAPNDNSGAGAVYLFSGFVSGGHKSVSDALVKITGNPGEQFGAFLATGDFNGDGYREIVVGAPGANKIYIFNGGAALGTSPTQMMTTAAASTVITNRAIRSMQAGDLNGDGRTDLVFGAPFENSSTGEVYVIFVQAAGLPGAITLPSPAGISLAVFSGVTPGDRAGTSVNFGDFDADGFRDLFIGAPGATAAGRANAGSVYGIWGGASAVPSRSLASANTTFLGASAGDQLGTQVVTGDINRDTPNDVVMLAGGARGGAGELDVYYGGLRSQRSGTIDLAAGLSRRMFADPSAGPLTSAVVFEVTGEGARDVIVGVSSASGGPGANSGLLYFSISPKLILGTDALTLKAAQGKNGVGQFFVLNTGVYTVTFTASSNASWLTVSPTSSQATAGNPAPITLTAASNLPAGTYTAIVTITSTTLHLTMSLPVTITYVVRPCSQTGRTTGDFDGDGCADLTVFNEASGSWFVQGGPSAVWGASGDLLVPGDYNGDGVKDFAIFRDGVWYIRNVRTLQYGLPGDVPVPADYNGDGITDIAVYRPSTGQWFVENQFTVVWGNLMDIPVPGDYNGDGRAEVAVYRRATGTWYFQPGGYAQFGAPGDIPLVADFDGNGSDDVAVYRPSTGQWFVRNQFTYTWGAPGDVPVPMDRDGDRVTDLAVYRPSTNTWYIKNRVSDATEVENAFGLPGNRPAVRWMPRIPLAPAGDAAGDQRADITVFRPSTGDWYNLLSSTGYSSYNVYGWGLSSDIPVARDYDGDGKTDIAIYRPSTGSWWIKTSTTNFASYFTITGWGLSGDIPVPGDYLGTGISQATVFRPSNGTWYIQGGPYLSWGLPGDIPAPADYDGDGRTDLAVFRPSTGKFWIKYSGTDFTTFDSRTFGLSGDVPAVADFDGDGKADIAVFRPSNGNWYLLLSTTGYSTGPTVLWGAAGDIPVAGDFDGDGRADIAVFRPSTGRWYVNGILTLDFGLNGDIPSLKRP
ncbi:MAG: FG-GAP-like repeat-containing protein [Acidobacteriota bacterium]